MMADNSVEPKARTCAVTVNFHGAEDTAACISSIQCSREPATVIVVDNSPNDPKIHLAMKPTPHARLIRAPDNLGFGRGNNLGIGWALKNTKCEFVLLINNDARVDPDCISELIGTLDRFPDAGIATGRILADGPEPALWYGGGEIDWKRGGARVADFMGHPEAESALLPRDVSFASGCALLIRRSVLREVGGFDPVFFMYEEDVDLCVRVRDAGYRIRYVPTAIIWHKIHGSQGNSNARFVERWSPKNPNFDFHAYHLVRNSVINIRKHMNYKSVFDCLFVYPAYLTIKTLRILATRGLHSGSPIFRGLRAGLSVSLKDENRCYLAIE